MAKILDNDPFLYAKERDGFLRDLQHFHETRGTPFRRAPTINGHEIDLYLLYSLVTAQGGWIKVNSKNTWPELFQQFKLPDKCINAGVGLKQLYLRYLDRWEKVHFLGEEADRGSDDDEESRHKRWSARALHSVPLSYNYQQHNIAESTREYNNLSTNLYKPSDFDRVVLSLLSPLPNEQDFAINVCTLLSNDSRHTLKLEKYPRITNYLLGHAGVYNHSSLRKIFTSYYKSRHHSLESFWKDVVELEECLDLMNEDDCVETEEVSTDTAMQVDSSAESIENSILKTDTLVNSSIPSTSTQCTTFDKGNSDSTPHSFSIDDSVTCIEGRFFQFNRCSTDTELFNLGRALGTQDYVGQRVLQVASILRNLSFVEENIPVLSKNVTFVRFLLLCSNSQWMNLQNLGLDMLGNIACEFLIKDFQRDKISVALLRLITKGLESDDRSFCIASLDALNKLSQKEANEDVLARSLDSFIYKRVCSFLTLQDVMVLVYTLECLYSLSSLGEKPCNMIVNIHGVIDTLVSLVTVEGKSYGPKACIGMKLVETVPGGVAPQNATVVGTTTTATTTNAVSTTTTVTTTTVATCTTTTLLAASVVHTTPNKTIVNASRNVQITPQRVIIAPVAATATTTVTTLATTQASQSVSPQQLVQQQHAHQQAIQENEQFALAWIRATYEPVNGSRIDHQELYKHYINSCAKIGRRGVIAPLHFPRCVRSVFGGTVGPNPVKPANPSDPQYYEGIKVRVQPLVISVQSVSNLSSTQSPVKGNIRRKSQSTAIATTTPITTHVPIMPLLADNTDTPPPSPASPILKAQLSAPSKTRETTVINSTGKGDMKSQVMAHPHLSQALLGSGSSATGKESQANQSQSNTSLIKSLLATKVNDCMSSISMKSSTDCQSVVQVAARQQQQRLLAQQTPQQSTNKNSTSKMDDMKNSRLNGACQFFTEDSTDASSIPSTVGSSFGTVKREPPQPPPPPLAPLSNSNRGALQRMENDDSDSTGNNSLASSSGINVGISSTEDGDNSLTSFEGLLNGVPNIDNPLNDDSNSKDSLKSLGANVISRNKPLMLADLLEKKVDKDPPILNGLLAKELRIGDKGLELVENHIEKALSNDKSTHGTKRPAENDEEDEGSNVAAKKTRFGGNSDVGVNGSLNADSPAPDSVSSSSNGDEATATVSTAAAKLFADIAADILEDEEEELMQEAQTHQQVLSEDPVVQVLQNNNVQPVYVEQPQSQVLVAAQPRQIIVSQPTIQATNQVVLPAGAQLKPGQTVIVQNTAQQRPQMVIQQANTGQFLLSSGIQGQMQLVASTTQPGQYVLQTGGTQGAYVVAQSQTAMVHGQPQTVLVAQTAQQQGSPTKTIIILQQPNTAATHHQKVVVTPQGQQVVVTQVQRPLLQTASTTSNIVPTPTSTVIKTTGSVAISQSVAPTTCTVIEKKIEEPKPAKPKILRDVTTPFVCEWGDCQTDIKFKSANQVYLHVCASHCPETEEELTCLWDRCDNMKRKRFSLMTHIFDKHCNLEAMKQSQAKRKVQSQTGKPEPPTPSPVVPHPGYAPDAALHAIKRHALEFVNPKELQQGTAKQGTVTASPSVPRSGPTSTEQDDNEGPVTKSMRLTAALILRNLVIYSNNCKRYLRHYEPHLANVALSNVESSRTVAQILYDMSDSVTRR